MSEEHPLAGGNVGGAVRVGDTVRRASGPWTPAVHALLHHLADRLPGVPRELGIDERGREVLSYLPGRVVDIDTEVLTPGQLSHWRPLSASTATRWSASSTGLRRPVHTLAGTGFAWNGVPLWAEDVPPARAAQRLELIAGTYAGPHARSVLQAVPRRVELMLHTIVAGAAAGDAGLANLLTVGEPERSRRSLDGLRHRIPQIEAALR